MLWDSRRRSAAALRVQRLLEEHDIDIYQHSLLEGLHTLFYNPGTDPLPWIDLSKAMRTSA